MVNNFWALRREITENNGNTRLVQPNTQTRNNHQSENGYLTTPQTMQQRPQNHHLMDVNNFNEGIILVINVLFLKCHILKIRFCVKGITHYKLLVLFWSVCK